MRLRSAARKRRDASKRCASGSRSARLARLLASPGTWRVLLAAVLAFVPGCAARRGPAPSRPRPGYVRLADSLSSVDGRVLRGRRIVLDPGHGGYFRGSLGVRGLAEAEVNLGVAMRLADLLVAHGADVRLTREDDRDFLTPADSSLRADLAERVRLANEFEPDLFVSIHHNADAGGSHKVSETQTYWKLGDDGASFDAAQDVHRALVRNVGLGSNRLLPGNYSVLRGSEAPALLTESSYLTFPPTERKLRTSEALQLEAEALYLGLAKYFARRVPVIESLQAWGGGGSPDTLVDTAFPTFRARLRGAYDTVELRLDGAPLTPAARYPDGAVWRATSAVPPGRHEAVARAWLSGEGAARERRLSFVVSLPYHHVEVGAWPPGPWNLPEPLAIRIRPLTEDGLVVPETLSFRLRARTRWSAPAETVVTASDGVAWAYFRAASEMPHPPGRFELDVDVPAIEPARAAATRREERLEVRANWGEVPVARTGFATLMPEGAPLRGAPGTEGVAPRITWLNRDGYAQLPAMRADEVGTPRLAGYRAWPADSTWPPRFVALFGGALHRRRIALDPAGNGDIPGVPGADPSGVSASGTRASNLNLEVARALASMLRGAGAEVVIVRDGVAPVLDVERVRRSEAFRAERYLRIGHGPYPPRLGYYFSSSAGRAWAVRTAAALDALGLPAATPSEDAQWPLQQTSCPALYASLGRVDDPAGERRLLAPGTLRHEAYALFVALAREWSGDARWPADTLEVRDADGAPLPGAIVTLGEALEVAADSRGVARFLRTEAGPIEVAVDDPRGRARRVLLDSDRGAVLRLER